MAWRSGVDPAGFAELLASAHTAAEAANPDVDVLMGGLGAAVKPDSLGVRAFLEGAYAAEPSLKGHTEALNLHIYPGPELGENSFLAHTLWDVRDVRASNNDDETPVIVTETGVSTSGPAAVNDARCFRRAGEPAHRGPRLSRH